MSSLVFIDSRVQDHERLIAGLAPDTQVVILDPLQDGISQIATALAGVTDLDSIHIISHGSSGTLYLGSTILKEDNLDDYEDELAQIGAALSEDGDLLFYGCNVGAGTTGESFIASLAEYTGADVTASDDITGSSALGGDWVLETVSGTIESNLVVTAEAQNSYAHVLVPGSVFTGTENNDTLTGGVYDDQISGLAGDDELDGNLGNDFIDGGADDDTIVGSGGNDTMLGSDGDDTFRSFGSTDSVGDDSLVGGAGSDTFNDVAGANTLVGGGNADHFILRFAFQDVNSVATGGGGRDRYELATEEDADSGNFWDWAFAATDFVAGAGGDLLDCNRLLDSSAAVGSYAGGNPFAGSQGILRVIQSGPDAVLQWDRDGAAGDAYGWVTQFTLQNVTGSELTAANVEGGLAPSGAPVPGQVLNGSSGRDTLVGGFGEDELYGLAGNDELNGQPGGDRLVGGLGNDLLMGGIGDDTVIGGDGHDWFHEIFGNDELSGGPGNDTFYAYGGGDVLNGGGGADYFAVSAGGGSTAVTGGAGVDTYDLTYDGPGPDFRVTDFAVGAGGDLIDLNQLIYYFGIWGGYTGGNPFDVDQGYLRLVSAGGDTQLQADLDGAAGSAFDWERIFVLQGITGGLTSDNFVGGISPDGSAVPGEVLTGTLQHDELYGGFFNDTISGLGGGDSLSGGGGDDVVSGGADTDVLEGDVGHDTLVGGEGDDYLYGGPGDDSMSGGAGDDWFDGFAGANRLVGGDGADYFYDVDSYSNDSPDTLTGGNGQDTYEFAALGGPVLLITDFEAGPGGDALDIDTLLGDWYSGGNPFDPDPGFLRLLQSGPDTLLQQDLDGAAGAVYAWESLVRLAGVVEDGITSDNFAGMLLLGTENDDTLLGGIGNDTIQGLGGNDLLDGSLGADSMEGGDGSDLYYVDNALDEVIETGNAAPLALGPVALDDFTDTVIAVVNYSLSNVDYVENLTLSSTATEGTGNGLNNVITGNSLANTLAGLGGADTLVGSKGKDTLTGGTGADLLKGGGGNDRLTGEAGADTFAFANAPNASSNVDRMTDFATGVDTIQLDRTIFTQIGLGDLDQGAYYEGTAAQDAGDRIIYDTSNGTGRLYYDADGDNAGSATLFATFTGTPALAYTDFFVVP